MEVCQSCQAPQTTDHSMHSHRPTKDFVMAHKPAGGRVLPILVVSPGTKRGMSQGMRCPTTGDVSQRHVQSLRRCCFRGYVVCRGTHQSGCLSGGESRKQISNPISKQTVP